MRMRHVTHCSPRSPEPQAVGSGLIALDVILDKESSAISSAVGGSAGNVLALLAYLGWSSVPVCELGKDAAGTQVKAEFEQLNADLRFMLESDHKCTPVVYQKPGEASETHSFSFRCPVCGQKRGFLELSDTRLGENVLERIPTPSVFYFDRVTPVSLALAESYRSNGVLVVFEPSSDKADSAIFQRAISAAHILKYADNRLSELNYDVSKVALEIQTMGIEGLRFRLPSLLDQWTQLPVVNIPFVEDTAGAGDWCTAGMLSALFQSGVESPWQLSYSRVYKALRFGQSLAAINCMHSGARGSALRWSARHVKHLAALLLEQEPPSKTAKQGLPRTSRFFQVQQSLQSKKAQKGKTIQRLCCELFRV
jgi:fructokinase